MNYNNTSNPVFKESVFRVEGIQDAVMTIHGVLRKSSVSLLLLLCGAFFAWTRSYASLEDLGSKIVLFSLVSFVLYFITIFNFNAARITVPLYALTEGFIVGSISWLAQRFYPGIVVQAITGTFGVFMAMLLLYKTGIIRPNEKFAMVLFAATLGICFIYLAHWIMTLFSSPGLAIIHSSSPIGISFSAIVCIIAALNLLLDFEFIVRQSRMGAPEKLEWIAVMGLLVTLIWVYIEILRLLMKLSARRN
ncbi:MAG: Bax inhibitor-1/YccA family protein [Puniceicoccales bacterium]|jgi:uncharacterized YccA/Bax inhibitor family protein|nr:Bax inhibitor-1/YccA family protein [Puniceicoccales bacterium]